MSYLYRFEARGIQGYILGHRRLRRVIGASAIVRELVTVELPKLLAELGDCEMLMSAAGMAMVRFPDADHLRQFLRIWPVLVASKAPGLRTVQAWVEGNPDDAATQSKLEAALDQARQTPPVALPAGTPVMDRSPHRKLPALPGFAKNEDGEDEVFDPAGLVAMRRVNRDKKERKKKEGTIFSDIDLGADKRFPTDLQALADGHYIGIIHADGNGIGTWFREDMPFQERQQRSKTLKEASMSALRKGIDSIEINARGFVAGVPILFGGDDLVMVVRADQAMGFVRAYTEEFEARFASINALRKAKDRISLSVGVAFVRPNHAFYLAHRLASTLGKAAKEASKRKFSSVWFHRFSDLLDHEPTRHECPVKLDNSDGTLAAMIEVAERIASGALPRGPIRRMLAELEDERYDQAKLTWDRYVDVQKRRSPGAMKSLLEALGNIHSDLPKAPYLERDNQQYTPWADINALAVVQRPTVRGRDEKKGGAHG